MDVNSEAAALWSCAMKVASHVEWADGEIERLRAALTPRLVTLAERGLNTTFEITREDFDLLVRARAVVAEAIQ